MDYAARLVGLQVDFPREGRTVHAVRGADLQIQRGEILGLVGESGSGKTVLGLSLLGLLPDSARCAGQAMVGDVDMLGATNDQRRRVRSRHLGAVFQDPMTSLNPTMRVGRQVLEAAGTLEESIRLLHAVGVPDPERRMSEFPHQLSGGLRQRVMLAMATAGEPSLIIADEPTTALDVTIQAQVLSLFQAARDQHGCAVLLITHDLAVAATIADRVCVMYAGRIVELGKSHTVLTAPGHPYTASLMASRLSLMADRGSELPVIAGEPPDVTEEPPGCAFAPRCPSAVDRCVTERPLLVPSQHKDGSVNACHFDAGLATLSRIATPKWPKPARAAGGVELLEVSVAFWSQSARGKRRERIALDSVSFSARAGESVALVGESGSGKTTLLRVVSGQIKPSRGRIERVGDALPQMVFQDAGASLTPWLTIGELLGERLRGVPRRERTARVAAVLGHLGLPPSVAKLRPGKLSGGQRQRVALARAVIEPPELLLCDEPTSALDASLAATVLNLLGELRRELGFAMLFVTHDIAVARLVADRIVVMKDGRIIESGDTDTLLAAPKTNYTETLLDAVPELAP